MHETKVPPMLAALVQNGFAAIEGMEFSRLESCPCCGGDLAGYDHKPRKIASIMDQGGPRDIYVTVMRHRCRQCGTISLSKAPFYPDTRIGSPVVDLCVVLARTRSPGRVVRVMKEMGVLIDRGTVRTLAARDFGEIATTSMFGLEIPRSLLSLSLLTVRND